MDCTGIYRFHFCPNGLFPALRDYDAQVAEALVIVRALNKITKVGMPESVHIARKPDRYGDAYPKTDLFNKANGRSYPLQTR